MRKYIITKRKRKYNGVKNIKPTRESRKIAITMKRTNRKGNKHSSNRGKQEKGTRRRNIMVKKKQMTKITRK